MTAELDRIPSYLLIATDLKQNINWHILTAPAIGSLDLRCYNDHAARLLDIYFVHIQHGFKTNTKSITTNQMEKKRN